MANFLGRKTRSIRSIVAVARPWHTWILSKARPRVGAEKAPVEPVDDNSNDCARLGSGLSNALAKWLNERARPVKEVERRSSRCVVARKRSAREVERHSSRCGVALKRPAKEAERRSNRREGEPGAACAA